MKAGVFALALLVIISVVVVHCDGLWWNIDDDDEDSTKADGLYNRTDDQIDLSDDVGSGDIILTDEETSTPLPSTLESFTLESSTTFTTTTGDTTSSTSTIAMTPDTFNTTSPPTTPPPKPDKEGITLEPKKNPPTDPRVKTHPEPLPFSVKTRAESGLILVDPGSKHESGKADVNIKLKDSASAAQSRVSGDYVDILHRDASRLQNHINSCPYCLRRQDPAMLCPVHQMGVEIDSWAAQMKAILSHGCPMGSMDRERCCVNGDTTVLEVLRDIIHRLRDVHHVLQKSCANCPKDGFWSGWSEWSLCTVTCGSGTRIRTRTCTNPPPSNGGRICDGHGRETKRCYPGDAPVNGGWSQWMAWSSCSASCGDGTRMRIRTCNNPSRNACGQPCVGEDLDTVQCRQRACCPRTSGQWNPWSSWSECSATCGAGSRERVRTCPNPTADAECENRCFGANREQQGCYSGNCCVDGVWGGWTPWSKCSVTCGSGGVKERSRLCDSPQPNWCGHKCPGDGRESVSCNCEPCCVPDTWGSWNHWSSCSATCGQGQRSRSRDCTEVSFNPCRQGCQGQGHQTEVCDGGDCCEPDFWGSWNPWSSCSATCGHGQRSRSRHCTEVSFNPCGQGCQGQGHQTERCDVGDCCEPDFWGSWNPWSSCSATCGHGQRSRSRDCTEVSFNPCRQGCQGQGHQTERCDAGDCCEPDFWGSWNPWSSCSATCGHGQRSRSRHCTEVPFNPCRQGCQGQGHQTERCDGGDCCEPDFWGSWSPWSSCSATCGQGQRSRSRHCTEVPFNPCRQGCQGQGHQTEHCDGGDCCVPDTWGSWSPWSSCSATCGQGQRSRARRCIEMASNSCRQGCQGQGYQTELCESGKCPRCVPELWSTWGPWGPCPVTCGGGLSTRSRTCIVSTVNPCGRLCPGVDFDTRDCGHGDCCEWSQWSAWTGCPATCGSVPVSRVRTRTCVARDRRPCPHARQCPGLSQERDQCPLHPCPILAQWGAWEEWCPCNCRRGVTSRRRSCTQRRGREEVVVEYNRCEEGQGREDLPCDVRKEKSCPACIMGCSSKVDGDYPSCYACSHYVQCWRNRPTLHRCLGDHEFDAHKSKCVSPPSESCSLAQPVTSCRGRVDGLYHRRSDCRRYMECRNGRGQEQNCRSGMEFNAHSQKCEPQPSPTCVRQFEDPFLMEQLLLLPQDSPSTAVTKEPADDNNVKNKTKKEEITITERILLKPDAQENSRDTAQDRRRNWKHGDKARDQARTPAQARRKENLTLNKEIFNDQPATDTVTRPATTIQHSPDKISSESVISESAKSKTETPPRDSKSEEKHSSKAGTGKNLDASGEDVTLSPTTGVEAEQESSTPGVPKEGVKLRHNGGTRRHHGSDKGKAFPCHANCEGLERGRRYQSCQGCRFYLVCPRKGAAHIKRCHGHRRWDSSVQRCQRHSSTCRDKRDNEVLPIQAGSAPSRRQGSASSKPAILSLKVKGA